MNLVLDRRHARLLEPLLWLLAAGEEIYADKASIVGSIGVVSGGFGLHAFLEQHGVERRLHTAGASKARLDPFLPAKPEDVAHLKETLGEIHEVGREGGTEGGREGRLD